MAQVTLETLSRRLARFEPRRGATAGRIEAAVALVLVPDQDDELELLFIKRAERESDPWSGQMALPGGRRDSSDPDLLFTATRETREETGIELPRETLLAELDDLEPVATTLPPIVVRPFVFGLARRPTVKLSAEVELYIWTPLAGLSATAAESVVDIRGTRLSVQSFLVGPHVVWGMTRRILKRFLELAI